VAWTEDDEWFKLGGDSSNVVVLPYDSYNRADFDKLLEARKANKAIILENDRGTGILECYYGTNLKYDEYEGAEYAYFTFVNPENGKSINVTWSNYSGTATWSESSAEGITNWGDKTESDLVNGALSIGGGNSITKLTLTTVQALTVKANEGTPNFALEIDNTGNSNDVTVTVKDSTGTTTLNASVAGGDTVGAGKYVQLTCVGSCWTLAEFTVPTP
jgi:hypothetical protein